MRRIWRTDVIQNKRELRPQGTMRHTVEIQESQAMAQRDLDRIINLLVIFQCKWIKLSAKKVEIGRMGKNKTEKKSTHFRYNESNKF